MSKITVRDYTDDDFELVKFICNHSGSLTCKKGSSYIGFIRYHTPEKTFGKIFDDRAFYFCSRAKTHIRLIDFVVLKQYHSAGYGRTMLQDLYNTTRRAGINKITLRTSMYEPAINFWEHVGGKIIGTKQDDYEVVLMVPEGEK